MTVDAELLEILVCPNDRGEVDYLEDRTGHRVPNLRVPVSGARRHPGDADRRGGEARREAWRQAVTDLDDPQALRLADPQGMLDAVLGMPTDCRAAYDSRAARRRPPLPEGVTAVTFCGMGGSAVSGDVVRSVFVERLGLPVEVNRSPVLPEHCGPHTLVVCSSYSGNTAETLACVPRRR